MSAGAPLSRRADRAAPDLHSRARLRRKAWLLGGLALAFYVGFYLWNLLRSGAIGP